MTEPVFRVLPGKQVVLADESTHSVSASVVAKLADDMGVNTLAAAVAGKADATATALALAGKAATAGDVFTGPVTVPTPTAGAHAATKAYVDSVAVTGSIADATTTTKGKVQLAGDLAGTAAAPTVPGLAFKAPLNSPPFTGTPTGITAAHVAAVALTARGAASGVASLDAAAHHATAELHVGAMIQLRFYSSAWHDSAGNVITARPSARTDISYALRAPAGTTQPAWVLAWDDFATF